MVEIPLFKFEWSVFISQWISKAATVVPGGIVIVVDGVDKLRDKDHDKDNVGEVQELLSALALGRTNKILRIVSVQDNFSLLSRWKAIDGWREIKLPAPTVERCVEILSDVLDRSNVEKLTVSEDFIARQILERGSIRWLHQ